jgi:hypothetical protein
MQVIIVEQDNTVIDDKLCGRWNIQLLGSGKVVGRIEEAPNGMCRLFTQGNHPSGNRYRWFSTLDEAWTVALKWGSRRYARRVGVEVTP